MKSRLVISFAMIALTIAAVTSATVAYFSETAHKSGNVFAMGEVNIDDSGWTSGFPVSMNNMAPGGEYNSGVLGVYYGGTIPGDIYFGLKATGGDGDFRSVMQYYVQKVNADGTPIQNIFGWRSISDAFANWNKVGTNVPSNTWNYYKFYVKLDSAMDNTFQNKNAVSDIIIYAVQTGGTTPTTVPNNTP